jgi:hypothetical protein
MNLIRECNFLFFSVHYNVAANLQIDIWKKLSHLYIKVPWDRKLTELLSAPSKVGWDLGAMLNVPVTIQQFRVPAIWELKIYCNYLQWNLKKNLIESDFVSYIFSIY